MQGFTKGQENINDIMFINTKNLFNYAFLYN